MLVRTPPAVETQLKAVPRADALRILAALAPVGNDLSTQQFFVTEMVGLPEVWRLRKGDWRAVYEIVEGDVVVRAIQHRREAYR